MEMSEDFNRTNSTESPHALWARLHAEIIAYMLNRSATEGKYWEKPEDLPPKVESSHLGSKPGDLELQIEWRTALICAFSFNIALSVVGNIIVLIVLSCGRAKSDLNIFLINLALADLTIAMFCMPFTFSTIMYGRWIFGRNMCPTVIFLQQVSVIVSIYTLTAIGIDRYFAVMYPLKVRVTKHRGKILLAVIFLIAVSLAVVQAVFARARTREPTDAKNGIYFCDEWPSYTRAIMAYEVFIVLAAYFIPLAVLLYTYCRIGVRLWGRRIPGNAHSGRDKSHFSSKKKAILGIISYLYIDGASTAI
ncbi:RYamide receptor-like [Ptychodera flava]|uniref:RYamide receptor-like n=1 Tax=Ptychodera flava TaxID=63121 RepID=UPI003969D92C